MIVEKLMSKNVKLSYILFFIFSAVLIAWNTLASFFGGVAINFVGIVGLTFVVTLLSFSNKEVFCRIKDLFFIACGFCVLELIIYFAFEFGWNNFDSLKGFIVYQNILSALGMLFFAYISFRFVCEVKNKKIKLIEIMLGNEKRTIKVKKAKELSNGCLEEKPNKQNHIETTEKAEEDVIIDETEE